MKQPKILVVTSSFGNGHEGKGIHPNTIRSNEHLYEYYKQHSITHKQKNNSRNSKFNCSITTEDIEFHKIKPNRNLDGLQKNI
ncbi:hypothetical protein V7146_20645 [Gottfriedia acidiceleris]